MVMSTGESLFCALLFLCMGSSFFQIEWQMGSWRGGRISKYFMKPLGVTFVLMSIDQLLTGTSTPATTILYLLTFVNDFVVAQIVMLIARFIYRKKFKKDVVVATDDTQEEVRGFGGLKHPKKDDNEEFSLGTPQNLKGNQ